MTTTKTELLRVAAICAGGLALWAWFTFWFPNGGRGIWTGLLLLILFFIPTPVSIWLARRKEKTRT